MGRPPKSADGNRNRTIMLRLASWEVNQIDSLVNNRKMLNNPKNSRSDVIMDACNFASGGITFQDDNLKDVRNDIQCLLRLLEEWKSHLPIGLVYGDTYGLYIRRLEKFLK